MAISFYDGYETGGADLWDSSTGSISTTTGTVNTGYYSIAMLGTSNAYLTKSGTYYCASMYFRIQNLTDPDDYSHYILGNSTGVAVVINTDETLSLYDGGSADDTGTTSLNTEQWYRISLCNDNAGNAKIYIDGVEECSSTTIANNGISGQVGREGIGGTESSNFNTYFDDILFFTDQQTTDIGDHIVGKALPDAEGTDQDTYSNNGNDPNAWTANDVDGSSDAVYTEVDDEPPSDPELGVSGQQNGCDGDASNNWYYTVDMDEQNSGSLSGDLESGDTVLSCLFCSQYDTEGGGAGDYVFRIRCSDGTYNNTTIDDPKAATWLIEQHDDTPQGANTWTLAYFDSLEMGYGNTTSGGKGITFTSAMIQVAIKKSTGPPPTSYGDMRLNTGFWGWTE
jgi:hypothetical protein